MYHSLYSLLSSIAADIVLLGCHSRNVDHERGCRVCPGGDGSMFWTERISGDVPEVFSCVRVKCVLHPCLLEKVYNFTWYISTTMDSAR